MSSLGSSVLFQAEDGIRDLVRSRGLGDVYKRQAQNAQREFRRRRRIEPLLVELHPKPA